MVKPAYNSFFVDLCSESFHWPAPLLVLNQFFLLWKKTIRNYLYLTVQSGSRTLDSRRNLVFPDELLFLLPNPVRHLPFLKRGNWLFSELALGLADWFYCDQTPRRAHFHKKQNLEDVFLCLRSRLLSCSTWPPLSSLLPRPYLRVFLLILLKSPCCQLWTLSWTKPINPSKFFIPFLHSYPASTGQILLEITTGTASYTVLGTDRQTTWPLRM